MCRSCGVQGDLTHLSSHVVHVSGQCKEQLPQFVGTSANSRGETRRECSPVTENERHKYCRKDNEEY